MGTATWARAVGAPCLALATGCLGFVTPPATATASVAAPVGDVPRGSTEPTASQVRLGFRPLGLVESLYAREWDGGAGCVLDFYGDEMAVGPYAALSYNLLTASRLRRQPGRVYLSGHADWLFVGEDQGPGAGVAIGAEVVGFVRGGEGGGDGEAFGAVGGEGEIGIGVEAGVDTRFVGPHRYALLRLGLRVRIPFSAGILFMPGLLRVLGGG